MSIKFESFKGTGGGSVTGGLVYKGSYNATTSSPSLVTAKKGDFYIVSVAGTLAGATLNVGDHIVFNQDSANPVLSSYFDVIDNTDAVASVNGQVGVVSLNAANVNALAIASNLSDLNNVGTARSNLGLGTAATKDTGTANGNVVLLDATGLPAVDGSQLTGVTSTDVTKLAIASNLSDLNNAGTARTNLGLGTAATKDTGTANGNVVLLDATGLPAVDGSQLTGVTGTDVTKLAIASNLSDLNNVGTARTNLGLGTAAVKNHGTSNGDLVLLDATGLPAVDGSQLTGVTSTDVTKLAIANNLSDLNSASTARTNLGLGTAATQTVGTGANNVVQLTGASKLPAVDGSLLTNVVSTDSTKLAIASNLSDLNNAGTARTNLGLGTAATKDTGTSNGNVVLLDATGLPAVDGSQLTGVTSTDVTKLAIANNLSDLNSASTARTNLGLGTAATQTVGTGANNVVQLDGTSKLPAVDGSQLTNVVSTDSTKLAIANNLSDLNNATTARTNLGLGTAATKDTGTSNGNVVLLDATGLPAVNGSQLTNISFDIVNDSSPSLGGSLDVNGQDIVSTSNGNIELAPNGNGKVTIKGNATGGSGQLVLNCENNSHGITLKGPPHSAGASYTLTFPNTDGNAGEVLKSDGNGNLDWVAQSGGGGGGSLPNITEISSSQTSDYTVSTYTGIEEIFLITSGASININLPAASTVGAGYKYQIKNLAASYTLTIVGNSSETIDKNASGFVLSSQYDSVTLVSDGTDEWFII